MTLVSPGYKRSTLINQILAPYAERNIEFKGLNRKDYVEEGEMTDMKNLSSDRYPYLAPRKLRGTIPLPDGVVKVMQLLSRYERLAILAVDNEDNVGFYYDGELRSDVTGLSYDTYMVAINTKVCFFPEKKYITINRDGTVGGSGDLGASTGYISASLSISEDYAVITLPSNVDFKEDDAVTMSGMLTANNTNYPISTSFVITVYDSTTHEVTVPSEIFIDLLGDGVTSASFAGFVSRETAPNLDVVIEWNNRLWGANNADNTIYACKLGDPTNWQYYQGTSMDSYYAEQGTDGDWTGAAVYSSHLIFFKESSMCRIYGSSPSSYQISNTECYGVEKGSSRSIVTINDKTFYKSAIGIMAYQGGLPYLISEKFNCEFKDVVAGTEGIKYYATIHKIGGGVELMVLDVDKALWHKEDNTELRSCATVNNRLYYSHDGDPRLRCGESVICSDTLFMGMLDASGLGIMNPEQPTERYTDIGWMAVFGPFDEYVEERKIYSKLALRFKNEGKCDISVYISINEGEWELVKRFISQKTGGEMIPIIPRRCDRYSIKVEGTGNVVIKSLTRRYRQGTHGKL